MNIWYGSYLLLHYLLLYSVHTIKDIIKDYTLSLFKFVQPSEVIGYGHRSSESYSVVSTAHGGGGTHCIQLWSSYTDDMVNERMLALLATSAAGRDKFVLDSGASVSMVNDPRLLHKSRTTSVLIDTANGTAVGTLAGSVKFLSHGGPNGKVYLSNCLYCHSLPYNLVSVSQLTNLGYTVRHLDHLGGCYHQQGWRRDR